jgi:Lon protease-like protein
LPGGGDRERRLIPLFPLPGVVLFPGTLLPLHVFEPRYRVMLVHALRGDRVLGMSMIDGSAEPADPPALVPLGGAGRIVEEEELEDGRFNIILEGLYRYRILAEEPTSPYRSATVEIVPTRGFPAPAIERSAIAAVRDLFGHLQTVMDLPPLPSEALDAERLAGELALRLRWPPDALQELLATDLLPARFEAIAERLREWKKTTDFLSPYRGESNPLGN